jgi:PAS domain S-box-containing protein
MDLKLSYKPLKVIPFCDIQKCSREELEKALLILQSHAIEKSKTTDYLLEASYDGYWDWYIQDDYEYMSPRFWEILGVDPATKKHNPSEWMDLIFKEDLDIALENFQKHVDSKGEYEYKQIVRYSHANGSTVYVSCTGKVVEWDKDGQPIRMIGTHTDITEVIKTQESLKKSQERFELAIDGASVGIWDWDIVNDKVYWSDRLRDLMGICDDAFEPSFQDSLDRIHPEDVEIIESHIKNHLEHKKPYSVEVRMRRDDGEYIWIQVRGQAMWDENNTPLRMCGSVDDITVRYHEQNLLKKRSLDLEDANAELESINHQLEEFTYAASHDLMSPLRSVINLSQWIAEDAKDDLKPDDMEYVNRINAKAKKMEVFLTNLIDDMKEKISNNESEKRLFDSSESLNMALRLVDMPVGSILEVPKKMPKILARPLKVTHIFYNLIDNAIKYRDKSRIFSLKVEFKKEKKNFVFFITDNGRGIDTSTSDDVFSMFARKIKKDVPGKGLGLSMVKKMVEAEGGTIDFETKVGVGTTFFFTIPR